MVERDARLRIPSAPPFIDYERRSQPSEQIVSVADEFPENLDRYHPASLAQPPNGTPGADVTVPDEASFAASTVKG